MNIGEEICGEYLRHVCHCEFVQYNLKPPHVQGEIDVIGLNLEKRTVYVCEVAIHLITGLQYVKSGRPDNVERLKAKFRKDIEYVKKAFPDYEHVFMLWSPVVRNQREGAQHNQCGDVREVIAGIHAEFGVTIDDVINEKFKGALVELRKNAANETKELGSSVSRLLQVEEHLDRHLKSMKRAQTRGADAGPQLVT